MKKVIITKGLPASGKSSFALELVKNNPGQYKRINKDDLRAMLDGSHHSRGNEKFILQLRDYLISAALEEGKHVIIDDTNLASKHEARIRQVVKEYCTRADQQVKVEVKFFDVDVEECIKRDLKRSRSVGEKVIRKMHQRFLAESDKGARTIVQNPDLQRVIICDLDGTLAIIDGRDPYDASECEKDILNVHVAQILAVFRALGHYEIILLSGRLDTYKEQTIRWLETNGIGYDKLIMRKEGDSRKDSLIKKEIFEEHIKDKFYVECILDDRNQVVDMWRKELKLPCFQVYYGDF